MIHFSKLILSFIGIIFLAACATPLSGAEMAPPSSVYDQLSQRHDRTIAIGNITAEKNLGGVAPVTAENYQEALTIALRQAGWYTTPDKAKLVLNAHMQQIEQPFIGFSFTVKAAAHYNVQTHKSGKTVYDEGLFLPCTVRFAEALNGEIRMRKATACAVGENITHLLKVLSSQKL